MSLFLTGVDDMDQHLPKCEQQRFTCVMYNKNGKCVALNNTHFKKKCPFYKSKEQVLNAKNY